MLNSWNKIVAETSTLKISQVFNSLIILEIKITNTNIVTVMLIV